MRKARTILLSVIFAFVMSSLSLAVEEKKAESMPPKPLKLQTAARVQQITGEVSTVNALTNSITITKKIRDTVVEAVVTIDDKTKIMKEKENKSFADIKIGDKVVVKYAKVDGKNMAKSIAIKPEKQIEKQGNPAKKK
jgi:ribosomal protein S1